MEEWEVARVEMGNPCEFKGRVRVPHECCLERGTSCITVLRSLCLQTHTCSMCAWRKNVNLCEAPGREKETWQRRERDLSCQPLRCTTFREGDALPPSLPPSSLSPSPSLSLCLSFLLSSCLSPQTPSFNSFLLQSGSVSPAHLFPPLLSPQPISALFPGDRVAGMSVGSLFLTCHYLYLRTPLFPLQTDWQALPSLPHSTSCCKLAVNGRH